MNRTKTVTSLPLIKLICSCCYAYTYGRQWYNRDTGFGLCASCATWLRTRESAEAMKENYGIAGVHYEVAE